MKVGRRLAIKILNAGKFVLSLSDATAAATDVTEPLDRAMLAQLAKVVGDATTAFSAYNYHRSLEQTEAFFWRFCDDYVELVKQRAYGEGPAARSAQAALALAQSVLLRLFAPFLPFVTEEVWSWWQSGTIHRAAWPRAEELAEAVSGGDVAVYDQASSVLGEVRKAKSDERRSQRSVVDHLLVEDGAEALAALRLAEGDLRRAGSVLELELSEAPVRLVTVRLAAEEEVASSTGSSR
jgi:valyl-tRNA synthetase